METVLSLLALAVAVAAWLAARESVRKAQRILEVFDREYPAEYGPSLYVHALESQPDAPWLWRVVNVGRRLAYQVSLCPHWGVAWAEWQATPPDKEGHRPPPPAEEVVFLTERGQREVSLKPPLSKETGDLVLRTEWTDPSRRERHRRCWLVRPEKTTGQGTRWMVDLLAAPLDDHPACEACPARGEGDTCAGPQSSVPPAAEAEVGLIADL